MYHLFKFAVSLRKVTSTNLRLKVSRLFHFILRMLFSDSIHLELSLQCPISPPESCLAVSGLGIFDTGMLSFNFTIRLAF